MRINKDFTLRTVMGQNIVLAEGNNADTFGKIITLNEAAAYLWQQLAGKSFDASDAATLLVSKYAIPHDQAIADAEYIISRLADKGLISD